MEPSATSRLIAVPMDLPATELDDFDAVVRLYWPRIFRFTLASVREHDAAQSLTQDCFVRAYRGREHFRGDCGIQSWLMQIAVNLVRDFARNRRLQFWRQAPAVDPDHASDWIPDRDLSPEARALVKERLAAVWSAAASLPARQRTVFLLRFVEDMTLAEIAEAASMKIGTVKGHLFRALQAVRERLGSVE
jgi:RNA polymerase sigma-70 factor (ECF subfamily)